MISDYEVLAVADVGVLLRFADAISAEVEQQIHAADAAIAQSGIHGITETVPSYCALYVGYDAMLTDFQSVSAAIASLDIAPIETSQTDTTWDVPVCYDNAPDLDELVGRLQMSREDIIATHLVGEYVVSMYGFAPGYAYMRGVPPALQLPRKPQPVKDVPAGSVIIAGPQCLVTTLTMPAGWWRIGESPFRFLQRNEENQFPVTVGSRIRFHRVDRSEIDAIDKGEHP